MKRAFAYVLIFITISLLFGQDLNNQIDNIDNRYNTNIKENTNNTIANILEFIFGVEGVIVE